MAKLNLEKMFYIYVVFCSQNLSAVVDHLWKEPKTDCSYYS